MAEPEADRDPVELLADEFVARIRNGERPSIAEYVAKHPESAEDIRALFPAVAALERVSVPREELAAACASVGAIGSDSFGDFRIIREIGRGGMGIVFEAEQKSLRRRVALKVLPTTVLLDVRQLRRFQREAQTAARLQHPSIVPVFGVGQHEGCHYIVMQLIRGIGLDELLTQSRETDGPAHQHNSAAGGRPIAAEEPRSRHVESLVRELIEEKFDTGGAGDRQPWQTFTATRTTLPGEETDDNAPTCVMPLTAERLPRSFGSWWPGANYCQTVACIGLQAAEALAYAHEQGTLHRDIKPANLLLDERGALWITDFGLAKTGEDEKLSRTGDLAGTLRYMAPEQFSGHVDSRCDVYSLGLTLYELLTQQPAFASSDRGNLMWKIANTEPVRPRELSTQIPRDLETIVLKAIARDPADRYQSAGELAADMQAFLADRPVQARRAKPAERLWRLTRRNPLVAGLTLAVAALLALVIVIVAINRDEPPAEAAAAETPDQPTPQVDQSPAEPPSDLPPPHLPGPPDDPLGLGPGGHPPHHPLRGGPGRKLRPPSPRHRLHPLPPEPDAEPSNDDQELE